MTQHSNHIHLTKEIAMQDTMKINDLITIGPQPDEAELDQLRQQGFKTVVNLRTAGEEDQPLDPDEEGTKVESNGMTYHHEPVDSKDMSEQQVDRFREKLVDLPKPVYAHCKTGMRAGAFVMMAHAVLHGMSGEQTLRQAKEMGFECKQPELKQFVMGYVDSRNQSSESDVS